MDPPSSCTTAWPNFWLTLYRDLSRAMHLTAFWRGKTPRTLRQQSKTALTKAYFCEIHTVVRQKRWFLIFSLSVAPQYFLRLVGKLIVVKKHVFQQVTFDSIIVFP